MYKVLLISLVNWDSLIEIPVLLWEGGCSVDIFCIEKSWVLQNKFYNSWIPAATDPEIFESQALEYVRQNGDKYDWIIPADDVIIRLLNEKITSEDVFYKIMPLTKIENRELLGSKAGFSSLCSKYNITTPRYLIYNENLTPQEIGNFMGYPFLMKLDKSEGGYGVFLCEDEAGLIANLERAKNKNNLVFQQFIKGYDINVEALYKNNQLIVYNYSRTLKIIGNFGISTQRLFYQNNGIETEMRKIGSSLGLNGFCNIVFMYSENEKRHYLIEVDVRPNGWMYFGKFTGNSFSEGVKKIIKGDHTLVKPSAQLANKTMKISIYKKDVYRCLIEKDYKGLMGWMANKDNCWRYIPFYDRRLLSACNRLLRKTFRDLVVNKLTNSKN